MKANLPEFRSLRLAVFDCDGTLVDSQNSIVAAMHAACDEHGFDKPRPDAIRRMVGLPLLEAFARLLPSTPPETLENLKQCYSSAFSAMRRRGELYEPLYPGVESGLSFFERAGWLLGIATGKSRRGLLATLGGHGLLERFITLQTADLARGKPDPEMLHNAMAETGVGKGETVMIGDTTYDMEMARNAGTYALGVSWGYHDSEELYEAGAHKVIDGFEELPGAVLELMGSK